GHGRVGADRRVGTDVHGTRIGHVGVLPLLVAADEHGTAAGGAGRIDLRLLEQADVLAKHRDVAAVAGIVRGVEFTVDARGAAASGIDVDVAAVGVDITADQDFQVFLEGIGA